MNSIIEEEEELSLSKQDDGTFLTTMPRTGYKVKFRLLNGQDELDMVAAKLNKKRTRIAGLDSSVTRQFKKMIVSIEGIEEQQLAPVLNVTCATMLLPYAREAIDSVLIKGSFPPLMIPPINFESLFSSALKQAKDEKTSEASTH